MTHRTMTLAALMAGLFALLATGCATQAAGSASTQAAGIVFVLVRHAEKAKDDPKDPTLSEVGGARAKRLAQGLAETRLAAAYATKYRRTQLTAAPTSLSHHLDPRIYDAALPAAEFARQLRGAHRADTVLVVGHSNTIPDLAAALCACTVEPMGEDEFDRWIEIRIDADGNATLAQRRY
jgi:broad specificity phosphatase PhoE